MERFRISSLSSELNSDLFQLYNLLEQGSARGFEADIEQNLKGLAASTEYIESETRLIAKMEGQLRALQARVDEAAQQRCQELLREQRKAIDQQASQTARVRELRLSSIRPPRTRSKPKRR